MAMVNPAYTLLSERESAIFRELRHVPLEFMKDPVTRMCFQKNMNSAKRPYAGLPNVVYPGMLSTDPRYVRYLVELARVMTQNHPASITPHGFSLTGVVGDYSALKTMSGIKMWQANAPIRDNTVLLLDKGLATDFKNERHRRIAKLLWQAMFNKLTPTSARLSAVSSSTIPHFVRDVADKKIILYHALDHLEPLLDMVWKDDFLGAFEEYGFIIASVLGERGQADGWKDGHPKERMIITPEDALASNPHQVSSSKTRFLEDIYGYTDVSGMRVRTVFAMAGVVSYVITCLMAMARENYLSEYEFCWHHTTPEHILDELQSAGLAYCTGIDVTQMDQHVPAFFLEFYAQQWEGRVDERLAKVFRLMNHAPYFAPQLAPGLSPFWMGDPFHKEGFFTNVGLASGRPDNPDIGKFWMTFVYLIAMDDLTGNILELHPDELKSLGMCLKGQHPDLVLKCLGDDALFGGKTTGRVSQKAVNEYLEGDASSYYALLDTEPALAFLGSIGIASGSDDLIALEPNPVTALVNWFVPEHGLDSNHRQYWGEGLHQRLIHYSKSATAAEVWRESMDLWRHMLPDLPTPEAMAEKHRGSDEGRLPISGTLSPIDIEVLLNRSKLVYLYQKPGDVSQEIADLFTATVDPTRIEKAYRNLI